MKRRDQVPEQITEGGDGGPRLAIATSTFDPNDWGTFKFAKGDVGSETGYGPDKDGYWRSEADAGTIPESTEEEPVYLYVTRINGHWEVTPVKCPE